MRACALIAVKWMAGTGENRHFGCIVMRVPAIACSDHRRSKVR
jgi:hypothetical protein